jgi:hypothetical protein
LLTIGPVLSISLSSTLLFFESFILIVLLPKSLLFLVTRGLLSRDGINTKDSVSSIVLWTLTLLRFDIYLGVYIVDGFLLN